MGIKKFLRFVLGIFLLSAIIYTFYTFENHAHLLGVKISKEHVSYGVSASSPLAVKAGMEVLEKGGNAVDAAVAVAYVLSVVEPYSSGIGGGGEMLVFLPGAEAPVVFDYRETFPLSGNWPKGNVGVPGFVKGMEEVHKVFGSLEMGELLEPAVDIARNGFRVGEKLHLRLENAKGRLNICELAHFFPDGRPIAEGELLRQEALADTLRLIQVRGSSAFYEGPLASAIIEKAKGMTADDLKSYRIRKTKPVRGEFAGYDVFAAPPPSSGVVLIQLLQMAKEAGMGSMEKDSPAYLELMSQMIRQSYSDRVLTIADPAYEDIWAEKLTDREYAKKMLKRAMQHALFAGSINDSPADAEDLENTTHFVIIDRNGMMVSATNTLSNWFGSGIYAEGFFLNCQLKNFSENPRSINHPAPGKRPRSFICPTILAKDGKPLIGIGSPGGKRIPAVLAQVLIRMLLNNEPVQDAIDAPRFYTEDNVIYTEQMLLPETEKMLRSIGYSVVFHPSPMYYGGVNSLRVDERTGKIYGGADPRRGGVWEAVNR